MYEFGILAKLLGGDLVKYAQDIASNNDDVHSFLITYTAQVSRHRRAQKA